MTLQAPVLAMSWSAAVIEDIGRHEVDLQKEALHWTQQLLSNGSETTPKIRIAALPSLSQSLFGAKVSVLA